MNRNHSLIDINELSIPDRGFLKFNLYDIGQASPGVLEKAAIIFTSRGCPFNCTFCVSKVINQQRVRFRNMQKIFEEIDDIVSLGYRHIYLGGDTFRLDSQRVKEFCLYLISKHPKVSWNCQAYIGILRMNF